MGTWITLCVPVIVFLWAGLAKMIAPGLEAPLTPLALQILGFAEVVIAVLLIVPATRVIAARYATGLATLFLALAIREYLVPVKTSCGCFGGGSLPVGGRITLLAGILLITTPLADLRAPRWR